ncbi:hypothetical protein BJ508DRAFT_362493 [Ascobolus immersus RN42]|uniref:Uncharacterized protein n=1 Tax=Ascobolus immersus RN42 TaxID=1160509 RepID=A0A3N4I7F6_ASCIM|nr:hypothetical protein BJ508DRAFT_362493 [Ascobolus immersus RN42]
MDASLIDLGFDGSTFQVTMRPLSNMFDPFRHPMIWLRFWRVPVTQGCAVSGVALFPIGSAALRLSNPDSLRVHAASALTDSSVMLCPPSKAKEAIEIWKKGCELSRATAYIAECGAQDRHNPRGGPSRSGHAALAMIWTCLPPKRRSTSPDEAIICSLQT